MQSTFLAAILPNVRRFKMFFSLTNNKFVKKTRLLKISPRLKCVATLACDLSLITALVLKCCLLSHIYVLQGSVATRIRCDGICNNSIIANFLENMSVKNLKIG